MPAILAPGDYQKWFSADAPLTNVYALLKPFPAELMVVSPVSTLVNNPKNEGPQLLDPAG
jgi:putative SOS response-associated peptidase YedK